MGNQLTGIAPSQILPVEQYLTDLADYEFQCSLGSTRFFKVARAHCKEGLSVVKVFVIHDPSLPLSSHKEKLEDIRMRLQGTSNCLSFQKSVQSERSAVLIRQYVKDSLYDRISTRPFLNAVEKKWIAFQLLCALNQCHKVKVCHGDIKSENVMISGWNWLLLTDFASFKPTYLPEDNPSDFSYFFDTSRRRTCYIAPERFVESTWKNMDTTGQNVDLTSSEVKTGDLNPAMDVFSAGCVITELFTEGTPPFDLSQLLAYRIGEYSPWKILEKVEDQSIRDLIRHMMQKDPSHRLSAEEYLIQQRGKAFPEYFYTFLKLYIQRFASMPIQPSDEKIHKLNNDLKLILKNLNVDKESPEGNTGLVLIISLLGSCIRSLRHCGSKLLALDIIQEVAKYVTSDIILDRLLPYLLFLVRDQFSQVRADAITAITSCLHHVKTVPRSDAKVFQEYIFPDLANVTQDEVALVRSSYAKNIAHLAEAALRILEMMHLNELGDQEEGPEGEEMDAIKDQASYDAELHTLQELIQQKVVTLLSDPDNIVKQTLLESGITRLCVFFGRQKANDVLLSHMITFLNDKYDWHLRASFFDNIVGVAAYVGWQSSSILKPLLQQGLSDPEEYVVHKTLGALTCLTELGLLQKPMLHEFVQEVVPFLAHPGMWIRQGAVGFISRVAKQLNIADVHCNLLPQIEPFVKHKVLQIGEEVILLNALEEPVPRPVYDYMLRSAMMEPLIKVLQNRNFIRKNTTRHGHKPAYPELEETMTQVFRKLTSQGMTETHEDKLFAMKDFLLKLNRARAGSAEFSSSSGEDGRRSGDLDLLSLGKSITPRHAKLFKARDGTQDAQSMKKKKKALGTDSPAVSMNSEWKSMFGSSESSKSLSSSPKSKSNLNIEASDKKPLSRTVSTNQMPGGGVAQGQLSQEMLKRAVSPSPDKPGLQIRYASCKHELGSLVHRRREQHMTNIQSKDVLEGIAWDSRPPPANWKPKGLLVAHLHEHKAAVNRIQVSDNHRVFATCSNDGTVKIWECERLEGKSVANRSKHTYNKQGGQIKTVVFCEDSNSIASTSDNGTIHVCRLDSGKVDVSHTESVDVEEVGHVVDLTQFDTGAQSILAYATVYGYLIGWDLRSPEPAWKLKNDPKQGLITSFAVNQTQCWMAHGTSSGTHVVWDMRFQLPITTITHPTGARVRRLLMHPREQSWIVSGLQGNNEVSMWDVETGARQKALWASSAPPLSQTQASNHSVYGMYIASTDSSVFLLTAGSDMRVRFWNLSYPANSFIMAGAASDPVNQTVVDYKSRIIEGTEVVQEIYTRKPAVSEDIPRRGPEAPAQGHHDIISDVNLCRTSQCLVITASRDGVVKVWK